MSEKRGPLPADAAVLTTDQFADWMDEHHFDIAGLAEALGAHYTGVRKWRLGLAPITQQTWLALQFVALDRAAERRRAANEAAGRPTGSGLSGPLVTMQTLPDGRKTAMAPEDFVAWMEQYGFTLTILADALGLHRLSIIKWRTGKHPISSITYLALRWLQRDKAALRARLGIGDSVDAARTSIASARQRAIDRTLAGSATTP